MIERFIEQLINELGANGLLIVGLYLLLYRPLNCMAKYIKNINCELDEIITLFKIEQSKTKATHGKD